MAKHARSNKPIAKADFTRLKNLMKDLGRSYSIRVGIIGDKAQQKQSDSDLSNADLGAIHEFGATINVTDKMRGYLASQGLYLKKDTAQIVIPARSFLREPLLGSDGKKELRKLVNNELSDDRELNKLIGEDDSTLLPDVANALGLASVLRVQQAFETGGFGSWAPITEFTKEHRIGDPNNPPLDSTGDLRNSITFEVKENK